MSASAGTASGVVGQVPEECVASGRVECCRHIWRIRRGVVCRVFAVVARCGRITRCVWVYTPVGRSSTTRRGQEVQFRQIAAGLRRGCVARAAEAAASPHTVLRAPHRSATSAVAERWNWNATVGSRAAGARLMRRTCCHGQLAVPSFGIYILPLVCSIANATAESVQALGGAAGNAHISLRLEAGAPYTTRSTMAIVLSHNR